jgi:hypothetical protein
MKIGSRVVCVDDKFNHPNTNICLKVLPVAQEEYTIRDIKSTPQGVSVLLQEIRNPKLYFDEYMGEVEPRFHINRFREIDVVELVEEFEEEFELV